jgi:hypothetical protein
MDTLLEAVSNQAPATVEAPPRERRQPLAWVLIAAALAMVPWLGYLATSLPSTTQASHWSIAWVGLDGMEAVGLASTGVLLWWRDRRRGLAAGMTAMLLLVDAWFDVTTAAPGADRVSAVAMAAGAEVPLAVLLFVLALRVTSPTPYRD